MSDRIKSILIVTKADNAEAIKIGNDLSSFLGDCGCAAEVCEHHAGIGEGEDAFTGRDVDMIFVLGGDGTFISVARKLRALGAPLLGFNMGRVGFLADMPPRGWEERLRPLLEGDYTVSRRMALSFTVERSGQALHRGQAVNDLVVSRGMLARLVTLDLRYGERFISSVRADGLIVSTPTGSTAYGVSAGGPLVHPDLSVFTVSPICAFLNNFKPMVLPGQERLEVRVMEARGDVNLTEDGQIAYCLRTGDTVVIRRAERDLLIVDTGGADYFDKLKAKGFLTER